MKTDTMILLLFMPLLKPDRCVLPEHYLQKLLTPIAMIGTGLAELTVARACPTGLSPHSVVCVHLFEWVGLDSYFVATQFIHLLDMVKIPFNFLRATFFGL